MAANSRVDIARSDVVGSLLRPTYLREARQGMHEGRVSEAELQAAEDRAVREAIALQETAGLDVITDGELRRQSWVVTIPLMTKMQDLLMFWSTTSIMDESESWRPNKKWPKRFQSLAEARQGR